MIIAADSQPSVGALPVAPRAFIYTDYVTVMVISGMRRFPEVLAAVKRLGAELFPEGACQTLARSIVLDQPVDIRPLGRSQRAHLEDLTTEVMRCQLPHTLEWGLDLVCAQAKRRYQPLLASMLRWAADRADEGARLDYIRRLLDNTFDIVWGDVPFDPVYLWEPTP